MNQDYVRQTNYWHRGSTLRSGRPNPVVCGRKFCARCGRWRHVADFRPRRGTKTGLASWCETCTRIVGRERRAKWTPEEHALIKEYQRIWSESRRREAGSRRREEMLSKRRMKVERVLLPVEPLVALLRNADYEELARRAGVGSRSIQRLVSGQSAHVRIDLADKLAVAIGVPSSLIWRDW
jgi:hypothetical protein